MHVIVLLMLEMLEQGRCISVAALHTGYVSFVEPISYLQEKVLFGDIFQKQHHTYYYKLLISNCI